MNTILRKQFLAHVGQTSPSPMLVEVARAEGSFFYTPEGKRYYDLVAGVSVSNVGHCNPAVVKAVQEQAARYMHVMVYGELVETPQVEYAAKVASLLSGGLSSLYFVNSGAEAVEGALKLAKRYTGRTELDRFCILLVFLQSISQFLIIFCTSSLKCSDRFHFLVHFYCLIPAFFL